MGAKDLVENKNPSFFMSTRFLMAIFLFFGYCLNYMQKIDMGIAIVCMVNHTAISRQNHAHNSYFANITIANYTKANNSNNAVCMEPKSLSHLDGPFVWNKNIQGLILSAYFWGYILTQIPGGWLSFRFGGNIILAGSMGIGSLITLLIPFFARWNYIALIVCLFFTGAAHGAFWPATSSFWAYWAPSQERSRLVGISSSGSKFGNIIALSIGGALCVYGFDGGWPSIFYIFGSSGVAWSIIFFFISSNSPENHRFINKHEKAFIIEETKKALAVRKICQKRVPWKQILTSKACYSIFIGHFAHNWGNYLFLTQTPSFLKDVLKFDLKSNGLVSSIPYIASWMAINLSSVVSDFLTKSKILSITNSRRLFTALGVFLPALLIIGLSFTNCTNVYLAIVLLVLGVATDSFMTGAGYLINCNDVAGPYSGVLFGISNTFGTIPGIVSPYIASVITANHQQSEWQIVFIICASIYIVGGIIDLILLDGNIQPWAKLDENLAVIENEKQKSDAFIEKF